MNLCMFIYYILYIRQIPNNYIYCVTLSVIVPEIRGIKYNRRK
jgi:hypothetical protein